MSAARKLKPNDSEKVTREDIDDDYYISLNEIIMRTTYSRKSLERFIRAGELKVERKRGRTVARISDYAKWWKAIDK